MRPGGADAAAGVELQEAFACHLARRRVPVQHPVTCSPPAAAAAAARAVAGAGAIAVLGGMGGDALQRAVEEAARALRAVKAAAVGVHGERGEVARKRLRAAMDDVLAVWEREG